MGITNLKVHLYDTFTMACETFFYVFTSSGSYMDLFFWMTNYTTLFM